VPAKAVRRNVVTRQGANARVAGAEPPRGAAVVNGRRISGAAAESQGPQGEFDKTIA
jgi:hypothetical protein